MSDKDLKERYDDARYRSMAAAYAARHKHDAEKEPAEPTELELMAMAMGAPAPGTVRQRHVDKQSTLDKQLRDAWRG